MATRSSHITKLIHTWPNVMRPSCSTPCSLWLACLKHVVNLLCSLWARKARSVWLATGWTFRGSNPGERRDILQPSRPALGPTQPPAQWVLGLFLGVKRPWCGVDHPPSSIAKVKERVELYFYFTSVSSSPVIGRNKFIILVHLSPHLPKINSDWSYYGKIHLSVTCKEEGQICVP
jgi:hypothetical protein